MIMKTWFIILDIIIVSCLLVLFSFYFAIPALNSFSRGDVMTATSKDQAKPLQESPAITICVDVAKNGHLEGKSN